MFEPTSRYYNIDTVKMTVTDSDEHAGSTTSPTIEVIGR